MVRYVIILILSVGGGHEMYYEIYSLFDDRVKNTRYNVYI